MKRQIALAYMPKKSFLFITLPIFLSSIRNYEKLYKITSILLAKMNDNKIALNFRFTIYKHSQIYTLHLLKFYICVIS